MSSLHDALDRMALPGLGLALSERATSPRIDLEPGTVPQRPERGGGECSAVAAITWCSAGIEAKTRLLILALAEHHPEIDVFVLLLDEPSAELSAFLERQVGVRPVPIAALGLFRLDFLRFKLGPRELAEFVKPAMCLKAGALGYQKILSIDPDYGIFAPLTSLLTALDQEPLVIVPRRLKPPNQGWGAALEREVGALASAFFAFVPGEPSRGWLELWQEALESPGAFLPSPGGNVFEWWNRFPAPVAVLRDPAYGVSRANLEERGLRGAFLDGAAEQTFSVEGRPLVAFHFVDLEKQDPWRAQFGGRQPTLYLLPSLSALFDLRLRQWEQEGGLRDLARAEEKERLPGGIQLDARLRRLVQRHEAVFLSELDPFSAGGVDSFVRRLFWPAPGTFLVPALLWEIYLERADLQVAFPEARIAPDRLIAWFCAHGAAELHYLPLLDRFRPTLPRREGLLHLYRIVEAAPATFGDLAAPLGRDRQAFIDRLAQAGYLSEARGVAGLDAEIWVLCRIAAVRRLVETRPDLQQAFPDYLGEDLENLAIWLDSDGVQDHDLPPGCGELLRRKAGGRALGRIYSFYRRYAWLQEKYPAAFSGEASAELATAILEGWPADCEFDHDDVVFFLWEMSTRPRQVLLEATSRSSSAVAAPDFSAGTGINCFGYFRSPIGLGNLSRGLARALEAGGFPVARQVVGCPEMDAELTLADFFGSFRDDFATNIFVSYPHLHQHLLAAEPPSRVSGRRNIVYLAWEQRDFHPFWKEVFAGFDQVWAISSFAAGSLRRALERDVSVLPAVLDFDQLPPPARPEEVGLYPERCTFLYVFDVFSAVERKNPLGLIEAFRRAFRRDDRVELRLKASHGERPEHWSQLRRLLEAAARTGLRITFERRRLPRHDLLRLISAASAYVSLHRAEGFGYTCAEAMAYGVPVIATGYSGNLDFMDENSARLVRYREREVEVPDGPFQRGSVWAEPELDHAAELMRWVYEERAAAGALGARGAKKVREKLAPGAVAQLLRKVLGER